MIPSLGRAPRGGDPRALRRSARAQAERRQVQPLTQKLELAASVDYEGRHGDDELSERGGHAPRVADVARRMQGVRERVAARAQTEKPGDDANGANAGPCSSPEPGRLLDTAALVGTKTLPTSIGMDDKAAVSLASPTFAQWGTINRARSRPPHRGLAQLGSTPTRGRQLAPGTAHSMGHAGDRAGEQSCGEAQPTDGQQRSDSGRIRGRAPSRGRELSSETRPTATWARRQAAARRRCRLSELPRATLVEEGTPGPQRPTRPPPPRQSLADVAGRRRGRLRQLRAAVLLSCAASGRAATRLGGGGDRPGVGNSA